MPASRRPARHATPVRRATPVLGAILLTGCLALTGCAVLSDGPAGPTLPPRPADETWTPPQIPGVTPPPTEDVTFTPCPREAPAPGRSDLVALPTLPEESGPNDPSYGGIPFDGPLLVEDAGDLHLPDGRLAVGNGGEALIGGGSEVVSVADGPVTAAISVAVLDSAYSGRRVAFLAAQLPGGPAVRWEEHGGMVTDGGDAALIAAGALLAPTDLDAATMQMSPAIFDDDGVCAQRQGGDATDAVVTTIGGGDGWYPVLVGHAADGTVVGVVVWGLITPWEWSGLPGDPPPDR